MSDIIKLLPDSIANQIAAGEVIQRPSSVIKELVENAIDAAATSIQIIIKDAGRTLIQVIDNGSGMSVTDVRMAFERHATSKIRSAIDLFSLHTMGFRGEALPSIAAIAQITVKTCKKDDELGTLLEISGSKVEKQEPISCSIGTNIAVKNIFFNVPARRKFLKSNETERRNIFVELERIMLVNPNVEFIIMDNDIEVFKYPVCSLRQRIINVVGKNFAQQLININIDTTLVKINGFIGKPEYARKTRAQQFFFVNNRFMKHPYFHKAVTVAYESLIGIGENPNYFIYLDVDPSSLDVNIHPTKTEIKFENEQPIWQILASAIKEALGKFNEVPSIDFDMKDAVEIPIYNPQKGAEIPQISYNNNYNPFKSPSSYNYNPINTNWDQLYKDFETQNVSSIEDSEVDIDILPEMSVSKSLFDNDSASKHGFESSGMHYQYKHKYILTSVKSGLMCIDQRRAHIRILFDSFMLNIEQKKGISQKMLFPEIIEFTPSEVSMISYLEEDFEALGFELSNLGGNSYAINGIPSEVMNLSANQLIHDIMQRNIDKGIDVKDEIRESIALSMAYSAAIKYGHKLDENEMIEIVNQLFSSPLHKYTPDGKMIISLIEDSMIDKMFK